MLTDEQIIEIRKRVRLTPRDMEQLFADSIKFARAIEAAALAAREPHRDPRYTSPADYARQNPLGGVAKMFEAMAERLRAGEDYLHVLRDYGLCEAGEPVAWATPSLLATLSAVEKNHLTNPDRRKRGGEFESAARDAERYSVPLSAPAREQEPPFKTDVCGVCWHCGGALLSNHDCPAFPAREQDERKGEAC